MLRLTLRTLLAYLDDTLEPAQAKDIGKKVAESEVARTTVERIKTVTRRRRLSAPAILPDDDTADPNTIAEYLDNVLPAEQVTELEETALDHDVRLAEVAACHQILTLVLGEPAKVPPTASRRMYRLVTGPESLPYRKPTAATAPVAGVAPATEVDDFHDDDDPLSTILGPRNALWLLWVAVAVAVLGVSVWLAIPPTPREPSPRPIVVAAAPAPSPVVVPQPPSKKPDEPVIEPKPKEPTEPQATQPPDLGPMPREVGVPFGPGAVGPEDTERRAVATWDTPPQPLLLRKRDTDRWDRVAGDGRVSSTDTILALPGARPEVNLDSGVRLQLWGNVSDYLPLPLSETRVKPLVPTPGVDAEFRLERGRVFVTAPKSTRPTFVRIRFREEVWDVTLLTPDTEVAIDLTGEPARGPVFGKEVPEPPRAVALLGVLRGSARVKHEFTPSPDLGVGARWKWDSKAGRSVVGPKDDPDDAGVPSRWSKDVPATPVAKEASAAAAELLRRVQESMGPFDVEFKATVEDRQEPVGRRVLAAAMLAAVDGVSSLVDAMEFDSAPVRDAAVRSLRQWIAQDPTHDALLGDALGMKSGFTETQREAFAMLLHGTERPSAELLDQVFELLTHEKLAVREAARMQLARLDPTGAKESAYDAASDRRSGMATAWKMSWTRRNKK